MHTSLVWNPSEAFVCRLLNAFNPLRSNVERDWTSVLFTGVNLCQDIFKIDYIIVILNIIGKKNRLHCSPRTNYCFKYISNKIS